VSSDTGDIGKVTVWFGPLDSTIKATGSEGRPAFNVIRAGSEHRIVQEGANQEVGQVREISGGQYCKLNLTLVPNLSTDSKGLILIMTFLLVSCISDSIKSQFTIS